MKMKKMKQAEGDYQQLDLTPQRCNKHNKLRHDFFISYRVSKDAATAVKLAAFLDGAKRPDGSNFITYLDKNCLVQGKNWESGFSYGINNSKAILLLISEGLITTMYNKAKAGDVDNVLKEHKMALQLKTKGKLIIPVYLSTQATTAEWREYFVKFSPQRALEKFDRVNSEDPVVLQRLQDVKGTLEQIFHLPAVHMQPDCIPEKVPTIVQMWYSGFVKKGSGIKKVGRGITEKYLSWIRYPSQRFRLAIIGSLMGIVLPIVTLSLLFMPSKSRRHTDLKRGVAYGNIIGFFAVILIALAFAASRYQTSTGMWCTQCEAIMLAEGSGVTTAYLEIPEITPIINKCVPIVNSDTDWRYNTTSLACICNDVYLNCVHDNSVVWIMVIFSGCMLNLILATSVFVARFTRMEEFTVSAM